MIPAKEMERAREEIRSRALVLCRKVRGLSAEDLEQEGWVVALEAWQSYDPAKGSWGAYLGRALSFKLMNCALRTLFPVKTPKNREHQFFAMARRASPADSAVVMNGENLRDCGGIDRFRSRVMPTPAAIMAGVSPYPDPETTSSVREVAEDLWALVGEVSPQVHDGLKSGMGPTAMALEFGGKPRRWSKATSKAYAAARQGTRVTRQDAIDLLSDGPPPSPA